MHGSRFDSFTRRYVGERERLYNPETSDWPPDDPDHDANWDWLILILLAFGIVGAAGIVLILVSAIFL